MHTNIDRHLGSNSEAQTKMESESNRSGFLVEDKPVAALVDQRHLKAAYVREK